MDEDETLDSTNRNYDVQPSLYDNEEVNEPYEGITFPFDDEALNFYKHMHELWVSACGRIHFTNL